VCVCVCVCVSINHRARVTLPLGSGACATRSLHRERHMREQSEADMAAVSVVEGMSVSTGGVEGGQGGLVRPEVVMAQHCYARIVLQGAVLAWLCVRLRRMMLRVVVCGPG
jgi:hypothetical protein